MKKLSLIDIKVDGIWTNIIVEANTLEEALDKAKMKK